MGNMIHVVKKQREYGKSEAFKYGFGEFKDLLSSLGCEVYDLDDYSSSEQPGIQFSGSSRQSLRVSKSDCLI